MSHVFSGTVQGSVIVLDDNLRLPEGTAVEVFILAPPTEPQTGNPALFDVDWAICRKAADEVEKAVLGHL